LQCLVDPKGSPDDWQHTVSVLVPIMEELFRQERAARARHIDTRQG